MIWIDDLMPHVKALHLSFLAVWVAGLIALPRMLARHDRAIVQAEFSQIRRATHFGYVWVTTPAAVLAISTGTALVFMRDAFTVWMLAKVVLVTGFVAMHAWVGHTIIAVAQTEGQHEPPEPLLPTLIIGTLLIAVLFLVLAKPELQGIAMPPWLLKPLGHHLPFDVPNL